MDKFANYILQEKIHETRNSIIYRGHKENESQTFIIKLLKTAYPTPSEIARFRQEYTLIKGLDLEGVIRTFDIISSEDRFALILEDFDGVSIKSLPDDKKRFDLKSFLEISAKIAQTLGSIHVKKVIHRDIKPHNILINQKTGAVKITDFGISTVLTHENDEVYNPDFIVGTLAYMSPEQTGRMNRAVDYRTDLYSLGITLYEMITGRLPFESHDHDPMEIIHSHIAIMPKPPTKLDAGIPVIISDIIMRLLSKNPEERYQNGFGLEADLRKCLKQLEAKQKIEAFELGRNDISDRFIIPPKLFGRGKEIGELMSSFDAVAVHEEDVAVMVVAGAPGIGKSAMINEIHKPIVARRGYFISGKYEQFRRDKPYSAIIQAFQVLVKQILSESEKKISIWMEKILKAVGTSGKVITDVIPEVEMIIGKQPALPVLDPEESKNRFNFVFGKFMSIFPEQEHPIVLFLDDLQWSDLASLQFLKNILTGSELNYFFLIISYRDNEVGETHQVMDFLKHLEKNKLKLDRITLGALKTRDVADLIKYFLRCSEERGLALAELVMEKTGGNPFFANQFLHTLYNEKMIVHKGALGWQWDVDKIGRMQVTDNLVEMMAGKIGKLSKDTQEVLKLCACVGNRFDLETLAAVRGISIDKALGDLTEAINEGMVSQIGNMYIFHHDRIQEAAYSLVGETEKSALHYKIGKLTFDTATEHERQNKLFYIVDQLNLGIKMIKDAKELEELARLNLEAGIKAKDSAAYNQSFRYLQKGIDLLENDSWHSQYELTLTLYTEMVEVCYLLGDFEKMNRMAKIAINNVKQALDKANIYFNLINALKAQRDYVGAINMALPVLREFGIRLPKNPSKIRVAPDLLRTIIRIYWMDAEDFISMPKMTDARGIAITRLLISLGHATFFVNPNLFAIVVMKGINLGLKYGYTEGLPFAITAFGAIILAAFQDINGAYRFGNMGIKIAKALNLRKMESRICFVYNMLIRHWKEPLKNSLEPGLEGYRLGKETGDLEYAAWNLHIFGTVAALIGMELSEFESEMSKHNKIIYEMNQDSVGTLHSVVWQYILCLLGRTDDPLKIKGEILDETEIEPKWIKEKNRPALAVFYWLRVMLHFMFNEYALALKDSSNYLRYHDALAGSPLDYYFYTADAVSRLYVLNEVSWLKRKIYLMRVRISKLRMRIWAIFSPTNKLHLYYAIDTLWDIFVKKNISRGLEGLKLTIKTTQKHNDIVIEAIANDVAGSYFLSIDEKELAKTLFRRSSLKGGFGKELISSFKNEQAKHYLTASYRCYERWGAIGKLKQLKNLYPNILGSPESLREKANDSTDTTTGKSTIVSLDLSTVMRVSQVISSEIVLDRLLRRIMHMSITNAGAQRGYLILESEDEELIIEASEDVDKKEALVMQSVPLQDCSDICQAIVNYVHHSGKDVVLGNAAQEGPFINDPYIMRTQSKSVLCAPIMSKGKVSGILYMENNLSVDAFTPERLEILRIFSAQAAISIENARLFELATTDGMTKLYVHRYFQLLLDKELNQSQRHNKIFALIMMDIDNFKDFNDTYGHQLGDTVLRNVARAVKNTLRAEDIAARYGGEEFVVILPETDAKKAMMIAETIRASVAAVEIPHETKKLHVTISLGVSAFPEHGGEKEALIRSADEALYTSKRNGKNRVTLYEK
ncbi:MAG: diguanylate cyclase [Syntrophaceae bacterium]|nr:diguanylate cyclase [Syntrophaceae bacterium]